MNLHSIAIQGHAEPLTVGAEAGRVIVCGMAYLPHEARKIACALADGAKQAEALGKAEVNSLFASVASEG